MKRKIYSTARERKIDQLIGFLAFPILNILLGMLMIALAANVEKKWELIPLLLPWIFNGSLLILMFIFRPHMAIGCLASIGLILVGVVALGGLFLAACFGAFSIGIIGSAISEQAAAMACLISFPIIFLGGLVLFCLIGFAFLRGWWILTEDEKKENTP